MGGFVDAVVILGVVLINAWTGYLHEAKAERAIEALARSHVTESTVLRTGKNQRVPSTELVPGDVVLLASGDRVPADLRLLATRDLQVAEAALTGESTSVEKTAEAQLARETPLADRASIAYASTLVTYGQGRGVVVATGTEVAKEASDMVLTDDNFVSIRATVEEGRNVFDNLTKIITWALPSNLGQGLVILAAALAGATLPILPLQVLWINMTTGGVLGLFLALEPKARDLMNRPPRAPNDPVLTGRMLAQVVLVGLLILVAAFGLFKWELAWGAGIEAARTVALITVAVIQSFYLINCRSLRHSIWSLGLSRNGWLWLGIVGMLLLQAGLTYFPFLNSIFQTAAIGWDEWLRILGAGAATLLVVEIQKGMLARAGSPPAAERPRRRLPEMMEHAHEQHVRNARRDRSARPRHA